MKLAPAFRFDDYMGDGAFSIVVAAKVGQVPCAIKFSKHPWANDPGVQKERDALLQLMLACNGHPHVATLIDLWEINGHLVTRWELGDQTLAERLEACRALGMPGIPQRELLPYLQQAAEGLDFINAQGIVHRDVKPENMLLCKGQVKIVDFGFARLAELGSQTNSVLGTAVYAPPEAHGGRLQPSVDIYCLAGTYIRLRTGQFPFGAEPDGLKPRKQAGDFHCEGLEPHEIEALRGALQASPEARRFATASALVQALATDSRPSKPALATPAINPPAAAPRLAVRFADKIRGIVGREQQERQRAAAADAEREAARKNRFYELLHRQFDAGDFAVCWGTLNFLQTLEPKDPDLVELRKFLDAADPKTGLPRGATSFGTWLTLIPEGEFLMGSPPEEPDRQQNELQHRVQITNPFYLGIYPVTVAEFKRFLDASGYRMEGDPGQVADHPTVN